MNRFRSFLSRKWVWAGRNKLFWINIVLGLTTYALIFRWPGPMVAGTSSDFRLRAWGMALQLIGGWTAWHDLTGTARELGAAGIIRRNWIWLKAGFGVTTVVSGLAGTALANATMSGRMRVRPAIDKNALLEQRVAALESYVEHVDRDVAGAFNEIDRKERELSSKINEKARALHGAISATEMRLKNAIVGNYSVLLFGAVWLFVGVVLSSIAPEIAKLVAGQFKEVWDAV